jgi:hypothetical protein
VPVPAIEAPSNRICEYRVTITVSTDLGQINYRICIIRLTPNSPPHEFEMLLTAEQYAVFRDAIAGP